MINKDSYILIFKDTKYAVSLIKEGYNHVYCMSDDQILLSTKIKYYPFSFDTHFPDSMFDLIVDKNLETAKELGQFLIEADRIGKQGGKIEANINGNSKTFIIKDKKPKKTITKVNIVCNSLGKQEGIAEYSGFLKKRFEECGIKVNLVQWLKDTDGSYPIIFEYEPGISKEIPTNQNIIIESHFTNYSNMFFEEIAYRASVAIKKMSLSFIKNESLRLIKLVYSHPEYLYHAITRSDPSINTKLQKCRLLIRHPILAQKSQITKYTLMPHIAYPKIPYDAKPKNEIIKLGSMGFALESKNLNIICDLAIRLNVELVVLMSINRLNVKTTFMHESYASSIRNKYEGYKNITFKEGYFIPAEMLHELSDCTHIISCQNNASGTSGSMRFGMLLGVPIISRDNFQAHEAEVNIADIEKITLKQIKAIKDITNLDDGFVYLLNVIQSG